MKRMSTPFRTRPELLLRALLCAAACGPALAQETVDVQAAFEQAGKWVAAPSSEQKIEAFSPALELTCREYEEPRPLRLWIARIDLAAEGVRPVVTEPRTFTGEDEKFETASATTLEFAQQRGVQLAVNTSAFSPFRPRMGMPMDVVGLAAVDGVTYSPAHKRYGAMYISRDGKVSLKGPPHRGKNLWTVIPGFRMLLDDRKCVLDAQVAASKHGDLNPRTSVGVDREGRTLWIVVADGRQAGRSMGMKLVEMAALFDSLGCWDALNLDGGGSSTMVLERGDGTHALVNTPVGRGAPESLRQVAHNLGFYLPGRGLPAEEPPGNLTLRDAVIRFAASRRGGGYDAGGHGVGTSFGYAGAPWLTANPAGTYCCGATLEAFLSAYRQTHRVSAADDAGRWFEDWPSEKVRALQQGWYGTPAAVKSDVLPEEMRAVIAEQQVAQVLPWTGLGRRAADLRTLRRGDFVQFWRRSGSGHSVVYWGRDRDEQGRERLWYWSSQRRGKGLPIGGAGAAESGSGAGYGLSWELVGEEIDPERIYGATLIEPGETPASQPAATQSAAGG